MFTVNWAAIITAGIIGFLVGFIWYNEKVLGKMWMRLAHREAGPETRSNMGPKYALAFIAIVLQALALAKLFEYSRVMHGIEMLKVVVVAWLATSAVSLTGEVFDRRNYKLWIFYCAQMLVSWIIMGWIIAKMSGLI